MARLRIRPPRRHAARVDVRSTTHVSPFAMIRRRGFHGAREDTHTRARPALQGPASVAVWLFSTNREGACKMKIYLHSSYPRNAGGFVSLPPRSARSAPCGPQADDDAQQHRNKVLRRELA